MEKKTENEKMNNEWKNEQWIKKWKRSSNVLTSELFLFCIVVEGSDKYDDSDRNQNGGALNPSVIIFVLQDGIFRCCLNKIFLN